jgi:hypothetical protein
MTPLRAGGRSDTPMPESPSIWSPIMGNASNVRSPAFSLPAIGLDLASPRPKRAASCDLEGRGERRRPSPDLGSFMIEPPTQDQSRDGKSVSSQLQGPREDVDRGVSQVQEQMEPSSWFPHLGAREFSILESNVEWLNDAIMDSFAELFAFCDPTSTHITNMKLATRLPAEVVVARRFQRSLLSLPHRRTAVLCINLLNTHWVFVSLTLADHHGRLFDSLPSPGHLTSTAHILANLQPILTQCSDNIVIANAECPKESDQHNCGVYSLVYTCVLRSSYYGNALDHQRQPMAKIVSSLGQADQLGVSASGHDCGSR